MIFSVITINYNNLDGLRKTIDSVLCQTCHDFEWIIIDGGSTDGSKELIEEYQAHLSCWCSEPDKGVYHAMNKGISQAHGDYLLFLNSGDAFYDNDVLQKVVDLQIDADIISGKAIRTDNGQILHVYDESVFMQLYSDTLSHQATFIKRSLFNDQKYDESLKIVSDWKFWMCTIVFGNAKVVYIDVVVVLQDMSGLSSDHNLVGVKQQQKERDIILGNLFPPKLRQELDIYQQMRQSPYVVYGNHIRERAPFLYAIGWRLLKLVARFV